MNNAACAVAHTCRLFSSRSLAISQSRVGFLITFVMLLGVAITPLQGQTKLTTVSVTPLLTPDGSELLPAPGVPLVVVTANSGHWFAYPALPSRSAIIALRPTDKSVRVTLMFAQTGGNVSVKCVDGGQV